MSQGHKANSGSRHNGEHKPLFSLISLRFLLYVIPCAVVLRLIRALLGEPALATVISRIILHETWHLHGRARTTRLRRPQSEPLVSQPLHVHRLPASRVVTTAIRPSEKARRDEQRIRLILPSEKAKHFSPWGLTVIHRTARRANQLHSNMMATNQEMPLQSVSTTKWSCSRSRTK
jgi:hypothetical protein